jgi:transposase InsO family protein
MTELCSAYGITRTCGYKWVQRFHDGGVPALADRSRAPRNHPNAISDDVIASIVALRKRHMNWGPKKLLKVLSTRDPDKNWPAESTVSVILKRRDLVEVKRRRKRTPHSEQPLAAATDPNIVWCTDFKGQFHVGKKYCHPLTITDAYSRFLLCCDGMEGEHFEPVQRSFERVFREYGLPLRIRSDNGTPFASTSAGGLSSLSIWWIRLGIMPERIQPGKPQQNGRHERMHRTLKQETAKPPQSEWQAQQDAFDHFRHEYNHERPHEALDQEVPASRYQSSPRPFPDQLGDPEYPDSFIVRRVAKDGKLYYRNLKTKFSKLLSGQAVGIEEIDDEKWQLWFGPVYLGLLSQLPRGKFEFLTNRPVTRE